MIFAIFAIVLLAAGVFGHFLVKRERQKQLARRENKLKIADGKFNDLVPEPGGKRFRKLKPGETGYVAPPPPNLVPRLQAELPVLLERLFEARKVFNEAEALAASQSFDLNRAKEKLSHHAFPTSQEAPAQSLWLRDERADIEAAAALEISHHEARENANETHSIMRALVRSLQLSTQPAHGYDHSFYPVDVVKMLAVSHLLVEELPGRKPRRSLSKNEEPWHSRPVHTFKREKLSSSLITRDLIEMLSEQIDDVFGLVAPLETAKLATADARSHLDNVLAHPDLVDPEKPTDEAVQAYIGEALSWAGQVHDARQNLAKCLSRLKDAHRLFSQKMEAVGQTAQHASDVALDGGRYTASSELKAAMTAVSHLQKLSNDAGATVNSNAPQVAEVAGPNAADDSATIELLKAAMRKVGFAVAQSRAAQERLKAANEQEIAGLTQQEPATDEGNADNYLRRHGQWLKAGEQLNAARTAKSEREAGLQEQAKLRQEQVPQSSLALDELLDKIILGQASSRALVVHLNAGRLICKEHKPKAKQSSSSSSAQSGSSPRKADKKKKRR